MSFKQLKERGVFLPQDQWDEMDLDSSTPSWLVLLAGIVAVASTVAMVWGGGGPLTWLGGGVFVVFLVGYGWIASRAVEKQNQEVERLSSSSDDDTETEGCND